MPHITLKNGEMTEVSECDFSLLSQFRWYLSSTGYAFRPTYRDGKRVMLGMHREIMGDPHGFTVDHINGNPLDNRRDNLRVCTHSDNMKNRKPCKSNTSGYRGVSFCKTKRQWLAKVYYTSDDGKSLYKGKYFKLPEEASKWFEDKAAEIRGEFHRK